MCTLSVARQPLPPQVICTILGMNEETVKAAFERGQPPSASEDQLLDAVCMNVPRDPTGACSRDFEMAATEDAGHAGIVSITVLKLAIDIAMLVCLIQPPQASEMRQLACTCAA